MKVISYSGAIASIMNHNQTENINKALKEAEKLLSNAKVFDSFDKENIKFIRLNPTDFKCSGCNTTLPNAEKLLQQIKFCPFCGGVVDK